MEVRGVEAAGCGRGVRERLRRRLLWTSERAEAVCRYTNSAAAVVQSHAWILALSAQPFRRILARDTSPCSSRACCRTLHSKQSRIEAARALSGEEGPSCWLSLGVRNTGGAIAALANAVSVRDAGEAAILLIGERSSWDVCWLSAPRKILPLVRRRDSRCDLARFDMRRDPAQSCRYTLHVPAQ